MSNHGARQLDYVPATISALEEVHDFFLGVIVLLLLPVLCLEFLLGASVHILVCRIRVIVSGCERCTRQDPCILGWRCPPWNRCLQSFGTWSVRHFCKYYILIAPRFAHSSIFYLFTSRATRNLLHFREPRKVGILPT